MTAQCPERLIIDGLPHYLYADPLYRLLASRRLTRLFEAQTSACWRGYCGTWQVIDGRLHLMHINPVGNSDTPLPGDIRCRLLRAVPAREFPVVADWFNGRLKVPSGRRLVYSHHGWSSWHERTRVMTFRHGSLVRDREVDTRAILEWWLKRNPESRARLDRTAPDNGVPRPMTWFDDSDDDGIDPNWWPTDYRPAGAVNPA